MSSALKRDGSVGESLPHPASATNAINAIPALVIPMLPPHPRPQQSKRSDSSRSFVAPDAAAQALDRGLALLVRKPRLHRAARGARRPAALRRHQRAAHEVADLRARVLQVAMLVPRALAGHQQPPAGITA